MKNKEKVSVVPQKIVIDRLTGNPIAYRDDSDAGMIADELTPEELEDLQYFSGDELKAAKKLGVRPESLRGGA